MECEGENDDETTLYDDFDPRPDPLSFGTFGRWDQAVVTWRLASFPAELSEEAVRAAIRDAFSEWARHCSLSFSETVGVADIEFSLQPEGSHGDSCAFAVRTLAHSFFPDQVAPVCPYGAIHFNEGQSWRSYDYQSVALHEIGHALGLTHSGVTGAVMEPTYAGPRRSLHADDVAGIATLYPSGGSACDEDSDCPTTAHCEAGTCTDDVCPQDGYYCDGPTRRRCNSNGSGPVGTPETCVNQCIDGACEETCSSDDGCVVSEHCRSGDCDPDSCPQGDHFCSGNELRHCNANGSSSSLVMTCEYACSDASCGDECVGDDVCATTHHCSDGSCVPDECPQGSYFCDDRERRRCSPNGSSSSPVETCVYRCAVGDCQPECESNSGCPSNEHCAGDECAPDVCTQNSYFCSGSTRRRCNPDGSDSTVLETCEHGCNAGACLPCVDTTYDPYCDGDELREVNSCDDTRHLDDCRWGCSLGECLDCAEDGYESNDTLEEAIIIPHGTTALTICANASPDWFRVWVNAGQTLTVTINFGDADGDLDLDLYEYDPDGDDWDLADYSARPGVDTEEVEYTPSQSRDLRWRVYPVSGIVETSYSMTVVVN